MAVDLSSGFDAAQNPDVWMNVLAVLGGFLAPTVLRNVVDPNVRDLPDELYGVVIMLGGYSTSFAQSNAIALGGGVYVADRLLVRAGLKQTVTSLGQNVAGGS
jgi:hypothetical protein